MEPVQWEAFVNFNHLLIFLDFEAKQEINFDEKNLSIRRGSEKSNFIFWKENKSLLILRCRNNLHIYLENFKLQWYDWAQTFRPEW
jgi:hypothetical protein